MLNVFYLQNISNMKVTGSKLQKAISSKNQQNQEQYSESEKSKSSSQSNNKKKVSKQFRQSLKKNTDERIIQSSILRSIIKSATSRKICNICTNTIEESEKSTISDQCNHIFCFDCLSQFCIYKININQQVQCPQQSCNKKLIITSQILYKLPQQIQKRFKKQVIWRQTLNNPNIKICPAQQCEDGVVDMLLKPPQCRNCKRKFCQDCMMQVHQGPCDSNFQHMFRQWKRCPQCKMFIQKIEGCNHMTCQCGFQFCYVCLADWQSSHYECIQGLNQRMFFENNQHLNSTLATLLLILFVIIFPIVLVLMLIISIIIFAIAAVVGALVAPFVILSEMGCELIICWIIIIPFLALFGAIGIPIMVIVTAIRPKYIRIIKQYCNTVTFLREQSC